ncbi:MAG: hypothetical protein HC837_04525 [Chloroflexaceae bacterium]|nr:hypothetical protein [Chloroflexaceae bacterium]
MSGAAVLDVEDNLVVGIINQAWSFGSEDQSAWSVQAVNTRLLSQPPFLVAVQNVPWPMRSAPQPSVDAQSQDVASSQQGMSLHGPPSWVDPWVERAAPMRALMADWSDPGQRMSTIVGAGGNGKSTLVYHWLHSLLDDRQQRQPDGVFWWNFRVRPSLDTFFEEALLFISGRMIDTRQYTSAAARVEVIGNLLQRGCYLFVLDGLDVLQYAEGPRYGLLQSGTVRQFLCYLALANHDSAGVITSRLPVLDLIDYQTVHQHWLDPFAPAEARSLLQQMQIQGPDVAFNLVISDWHFHPLTLRLIGTYLNTWHNQDITAMSNVPPPEPVHQETATVTQTDSLETNVNHLLQQFDVHLTESERTFLMLLSAFREPVDDMILERVFLARPGVFDRLRRRRYYAFLSPLTMLNTIGFQALINRLMSYGLVSYNQHTHCYTMHPFIYAHYYALLCGYTTTETTKRVRMVARTESDPTRSQMQAVHLSIKDFYLATAGDIPRFATLSDLAPLFESVYHACCATTYSEALRIYQQQIEQGERQTLSHQLGAYETLLSLMLAFFPDHHPTHETDLHDPSMKEQLLDRMGFCLLSLERLQEAIPFYEHKNSLALSTEDWYHASIGYRNLSGLHLATGNLIAGADTASAALNLARRLDNRHGELAALVYYAWATHLRGDRETARQSFEEAEALQQAIEPGQQHLVSQNGIWYAEYLRRHGEVSYAQEITEVNLTICSTRHWLKSLSQCQCLLGELAADAGDHEVAQRSFDEALISARSIEHRPALIEVLLARGRWGARYHQEAAVIGLSTARSNLEEAWNAVLIGGYRLYEVDLRVGLAWLHLADGDTTAALEQARYVQRLSSLLGYHWGDVDAATIIDSISSVGTT